MSVPKKLRGSAPRVVSLSGVKIGWPESRIILSECAIYLANSDKSNSAYAAIDGAIGEVKRSGMLPVPLYLRNAPTKLMKELGYGEDYKYAHSFEKNFVEQDYLPEELTESIFYAPGQNKRESQMNEVLKTRWDKYKES